jgi:hypothetical protein
MDQAFDLHPVNFLEYFQSVMHSAIVHVDFHRLCDPVSSAPIAFLVNAFQYLIKELFLITFMSLR